MVLPDASIRWILENSVSSNIEFFQLSNVNRQFRRVIMEVLLERVKDNLQTLPLDSLLLPCMLREIIRAEKDQKVARSDTFCAAWFHPDGIVEQIVSLREEEKDEESASMQSHPSFAPGGEPNISDSSPDEDSRSRRSRGSYKQRNRKTRSRSPASRTLSERSQLSANEVRCCREWRGYRDAMQVLGHFGASQAFVKDMIDTAKSLAAISQPTPETTSHDRQASLLHPLIAKPTFAVRGATVARPDSYCFCRDSQEERELKTAFESKAAKDVTGWKDIKEREYRQAVARIQRRRRDDQRAVLPRVLLPSDGGGGAVVVRGKPAAAPAIPSTIQAVIPQETTAENGGTNDDTYRATNKKSTKPNYSSLSDLFTTPITEGSASLDTLPPRAPIVAKDPATIIGRKCRSVQFLNTDGSHAVCMTTPPFACGPLALPITIFCVGIATEDGCFLSGLHHRFELGHMYPNTPAAEISELSAVCVATDPWEETAQPLDQVGGVIHTPFSALEADSSLDSDDSSCSISDDDGTTTPNCECDYQRVERKLDMTDRDDEDIEKRSVYYGRLGPGTWHCYVVVVDEAETQIRIDGLAESVDAQRHNPSAARAMLDGLTLGSDHKWDLSLCCGFGSGGEGEGAIAELAVFHGLLDTADIESLETEMMRRHGIPSAVNVSNDDRGQDYDWTRQAQALFVQNPNAEVPFGSVPLRYMARHRSVAWTQFNAVTGAAMIQQRIGARPGGESSEW